MMSLSVKSLDYYFQMFSSICNYGANLLSTNEIKSQQNMMNALKWDKKLILRGFTIKLIQVFVNWKMSPYDIGPVKLRNSKPLKTQLVIVFWLPYWYKISYFGLK